MEGSLQLHIDFQDAGQLHRNKLDWRERKRQAHQKRNNRPTRGSQGPAARAATPTGHVAAADTAAQQSNKRQKVQQQQQRAGGAHVDTMHGYGTAVHQDSQQQQEQKPLQPQQQAGVIAGAAAAAAADEATHGKASSQGAPPAAAGAATQRPKPRVVKGAVAEMQAAAEVSGPTADEVEDIMALVQLSVSRDQQLEQELGLQHPAEEAGGAGRKATKASSEVVVEFGDAEDEPDYAELGRRQQHKQQQRSTPAGSGSLRVAAASKSSFKQQEQEQEQRTSKKPKLMQHKAGELTHAEPNVPAASRLQLFGPEALPGVADDTSWCGLGLSEQLGAHLEALNFQEPTQVQKRTIPVLLGGRDALVRSPTGSGKTLAYLAPLVHTLAAASPRISRAYGTHALVLVPTRELAVQVNDVLTALLRRFCWLVPGILIGGEHRGHEKARLRKGVTVLVATPGRLMDHLENTSSFKTDRLSWLVLDEADRLLDLGFEQKLTAIIAALDNATAAVMPGPNNNSISSSQVHNGDEQPQPSQPQQQRQTVLLSATLHPGLASLAGLSLNRPVAVGFKAEVVDGQLQLAAAEGEPGARPHSGNEAVAAAAGEGGAGGAGGFELPQQLSQKFVEVAAKMRLVYLIGVLQSRLHRSKSSKLVVFFSNCDSVDFHHELFSRGLQLSEHQGGREAAEAAGGGSAEPLQLLGGAPVVKLHGDMLQPERTSSLVTFAKAKTCVLLCTDVAARGLDFPAVSAIIQYDPAGEPADYVHRVGRTARMGQQGEAVLFLLPSELPYVQLLEAKGMRLQEERAADLVRTLPVLLEDAPGAAGSVLRFARKLQQESGTGAVGGHDPSKQGAAGDGSAGQQPQQLSAAKAEQMAAAMLLQRQLLATMSGNPELKQMALNAYRSFVRAYTTHPTSLKHVFHIKSLHLGHLAASFGLREAPSRIGSSGATAERKKRKAAGSAATKQQQKAAWHKAARAAAADGS